VAALTGNSGRLKRRLFESTSNINFEYLPGGQAFPAAMPSPADGGED
jgi:hypothetical protein